MQGPLPVDKEMRLLLFEYADFIRHYADYFNGMKMRI